jgi:tRNA pseudouridine55 synthase
MENVINIYKEIGKTPLEKIKEFKDKYPEYADKKIAYAGRLDPMAHGVLILLVEPETKNRKNYERLDKVYSFKMMFGVETDTYDLLGLITKTYKHVKVNKIYLERAASHFVGELKQKYPPYSSARVNGKPLFKWAREGKLKEVKIPEKKVSVYSIKVQNYDYFEPEIIKGKIKEKINFVKGDFRQRDILAGWEKYFTAQKDNVTIAELEAKVSSGTYIRSVVNQIGKSLKTGAVAYEILRTCVDNYPLNNAVRL